MVKSMTGYGSAAGTSGKLDITIELRSVNNRFLDLNIRIPRVYTAVEDGMRAMVQKYISHGKVDVFVTIDNSKADDVKISVNWPLARAYRAALTELEKEFDMGGSAISDDTTTNALARFPDVLKIEKAEIDTDQLEKDICAILEEALRNYEQMRLREGQKLYSDIRSRADTILELTDRAELRSEVSVAEYQNRLYAKLRETLADKNIDENRVILEAAIFADRVAVNEEVVRLRSHVSQLRHMLDSGEPVGRKLDFIVQEMNREANTIGSKGNDVEMARIVIDLKAEIEKIREQIQNIE